MKALRSIANAIALRICGSLNGADSRFTIRFRLMYCVVTWQTALGACDFTSLSRGIVTSLLKVMSNSPAMNARIRVDRLAMILHSTAST